VLKQAKFKFIGPKTKLTQADFGEGVFMVESENKKYVFFTCNMKTG
jgi:hypothetical protein